MARDSPFEWGFKVQAGVEETLFAAAQRPPLSGEVEEKM
jgi:hypothetical protein